MAQVSYGTITITDTNDINRIYVEYCRSTSNQLSGTTVPNITVNWSESTPAWVDGEYIWQRTVVEKSGTLAKTYGTPVCLTGAQGETGGQGPQGPQGGTGAAGRSLTSTTTQYTTAATSATITQSNMGSYTWSGNVPAYNANTPAYWVRITNVYSNPSSTEYIIYKDNGITDAVKTSHDANDTAAAAEDAANTANENANTAKNTASSANTKAEQAVTNVTNLQNKLKYYWVNEVAHTNGVNGWTKPNYPAGTYAASGISGTTFDSENSSTYGYNTWYANGINLRYNAIKLGELTGSALTFYHPSTTSQGAKAMELSGTALKFYNSAGTTVQAEFGGSRAKISGIINAYEGYIGNIANIDALTDSDNYWYIGHYKDYTQTESAAIKSSGSAFIQLGKENTWRLATNRIHTAWNNDGGSGDAFRLHFPRSSDNRYWDYGFHFPIISSNLNDKFIYIRNSSTTETLENLNDDLDDNTGFNYWNYRFYVTAGGNLYARNLYVLDDNGQATQIGGTDGVYLLKSGGTITGNLTVNGTITGTLSGTATRVSKDLKIQLNGGTTEGSNQFTYNGSTAKTINITKSSVGLSNVENTALSTWAGSANLITTKIGTLAAAAVKGIDTSITSTSTSTNLPTSAAVATLVRGYLPLTGGNVTGAVTFGSSVSVDELTAGDLVVNGNASFTNNAQFNTINGVAIGSSPKFTDANVAQTATTTNAAYEVLFSYTADNTTRTEGARKTSTFTYNPSTKELTVGTVKIKEASTGFTISGGTTSRTLTVSGNYTLAAASAKGVDTSISAGSSSANLPTSAAVASFVEGKNYVTNSGVTTVTAGDGLSGGGTAATVTLKTNLRSFTKLTNDSAAATETANRIYPVVLDKSGYLAVNVPWTNVNSSYLTSNSTLNWDKVTTNRPTTLSGYGITDAKIANGVVTLGSNTISKMPNPNALTIKVYNASTATAQGSTYSPTEVSYDGSASGKTASVAGINAITNISASAASGGSSTFTVVKADGSSSTFNVNISGAVVSGATILTNSSGVGLDVDGPVYFDDGTPKSMKPNTSTGLFLKDDGTWATPVGTTYTFDGTYNASSNKAATVSTVTNAINALDGGTIGTPSASKTVTAISQTNGNISVTFGNISITKSQISDFPTSMAPTAHNHNQIVTVGDQRSTATTPNSYSNALIFQGLKTKATVGNPSDDTYSYLVGLRGWSDSSGGNSHELAFNNTGIFWRQGATTSWGDWYRIYTTGNKPTASDVGLGNVTNYDSSVAIKSITRSGTTFTYTTVAGETGTFTQQDNNTWNALSTSQAGYVAKAPNDTSKFLRGDATWAAVTKANVGLSNVENTALSTWAGSSNITTVGTISSGTIPWARLSDVPNYAGSSSKGGAATSLAGFTNTTTSGTAIDSATQNGHVYVTGTSGIYNISDGAAFVQAYSTSWVAQIYQDYRTGQIALRGKNNGTWQAWRKVLDSSNYTSFLGNYVTIAGDDETITGTKSFNNILGTKYVATKGGVGCEVKYNSTLDALVFSFA